GQPLERRVDKPLRILLLQELVHRVGAAIAACLELARVERLLVEGYGQHGDLVALEPGVVGVAHDPEQPGAPVVAVEALDELEGPQAGLLPHVLRIAPVAREPACEVIGRVEVGHEEALEACDPRLIVQAQGLPRASRAAIPPCGLSSWRSAGKSSY